MNMSNLNRNVGKWENMSALMLGFENTEVCEIDSHNIDFFSLGNVVEEFSYSRYSEETDMCICNLRCSSMMLYLKKEGLELERGLEDLVSVGVKFGNGCYEEVLLPGKVDITEDENTIYIKV